MPVIPKRRHIVLASLGSLAWPAALAAADAGRPLVPMTEGPFYPPERWRSRNPVNDRDWDHDLTRVQRGSQVLVARGEHLALHLRVVDSQGRPIDRADVEIWQCDAMAQYRHPGVAAEPGRFDAGFQGFGAARSAADGTVAFRTIRPG